MFFQLNRQHFIYYALNNGTVGKYSIEDDTNSVKSKVCSEDTSVVGFHYNEDDDSILTACSNSTFSEIKVIEFESMTTIKRIQTTDYQIASMNINNEGYLLIVTFNKAYFTLVVTSLDSFSTINQILIKENICVNKSASFEKFMQVSSSKNVSSKVLRAFNEEIYAVVEICIPNALYVLFLKDRLISIDANTLGVTKESERFSSPFNLNKSFMIASKYEIVVNIGSEILRRFNFDLEAISVKNVYSRGSTFYDYSKDEILNYDTEYYIIKVYNSLFSLMKSHGVKIDDYILFHKTANNFIYFVMTDSTIGKYDISKDEYELGSKVCRAGAKVVAFYANEDESLLTFART